MATADLPGSALNAATITRRVLFFLLLIGLSLFYLIVMFRGLDSQKGMEQAQIARELARGNGFTTKMLRPVSIWQNAKANDGTANLEEASRDTYHAPLHPMFLSAVMKVFAKSGDMETWRMDESDPVFGLDRVVAGASVICFLMAIGVNYLLICRIFDAKIGGVTALLMLLCDLNWQFSQTGLPQMFMLLIFSCACFFAYRAVESTEEGRVALVPALLAGAFFGLLALTHWLTIWIILGFALYAGFFIRPRGAAGLAALGFILLLAAWPLVKNNQFSGTPGGTAMYAIYNGLGGSEDLVMRTYEPDEGQLPPLVGTGLPLKIVRTLLLQGGDLFVNLGAILTAPLFFLALLHPFKRRSIASFRWCLLLMWVFGAFGMALFGLSGSPTDPNQLHILFAPLFAAYGLAMVAILWSKLPVSTEVPQLANAHFIVVVLISAGPLVLDIPRQFRTGLQDGVKVPHFPPYHPASLNLELAKQTRPEEIVISDQPWAVAWYADRRSIWLPKRPADVRIFEELGEQQGHPVAGILVTPYSHSTKPLFTVYREYLDFLPLVLDGWAAEATGRPPGVLALQPPSDDLKFLMGTYQYPSRFFGNLIVYWARNAPYTQNR